MKPLILTLALALLAGPVHAAVRPTGGGSTMPTNPVPEPPPTSWQPPFTIVR